MGNGCDFFIPDEPQALTEPAGKAFFPEIPPGKVGRITKMNKTVARKL